MEKHVDGEESPAHAASGGVGKRKHTLGKIVAGMAGGAGAPAALTGTVATFGTAGTGTAISTLSGAAATSATLAAIGGAIGGSVATGSIVVVGVGVLGAWGARCLYKHFVQKV